MMSMMNLYKLSYYHILSSQTIFFAFAICDCSVTPRLRILLFFCHFAVFLQPGTTSSTRFLWGETAPSQMSQHWEAATPTILGTFHNPYDPGDVILRLNNKQGDHIDHCTCWLRLLVDSLPSSLALFVGGD